MGACCICKQYYSTHLSTYVCINRLMLIKSHESELLGQGKYGTSHPQLKRTQNVYTQKPRV